MTKVKKQPCISCGKLVAEQTVLGHSPSCSLLRQWIGPRKVIATTVYNLRTDTESVYMLPAKKAVIYAYAQSKGDWAVTGYMKKYGKEIKCGPTKAHAWLKTWFLGDFAAVEKVKGKK